MRFWTLCRNDLKLIIKDRMFFFWLLLFPLLFAVIFGLAFPESTAKDQKVTLDIQDQDQSFLSKALVEELKGKKYKVNYLEDKSETGIRTLIIPKHFTQDILAGKKAELILEKKPESNIKASQAAYAHVLKAVIKVLTKITAIAPNDRQPFEEKYKQYQFNRLVTINSKMGGELKVIPSGFNHTIPGITVMFIIFTVLMYGGINLLEERRFGQLERIYLTPVSKATIIGGKWLSRLLIGMLQVVVLFAAGKILFGIYFGSSLLSVFLISFFFCGTMAGLSLLLGSMIRREEILIIITILLANVMASLGGCWWPLEIVPRHLLTLSFIFPTGWTMDAFHKLIFFGQNLKEIQTHVFVLAAFTLAFLILAVKFFKWRKY